MALNVNFGDKYPAGNHISLTVITDAGQPEANISLESGPLESRVKLIDDNKYKVRFYLPMDAKGEFTVKIKAGADSFEESKKID